MLFLIFLKSILYVLVAESITIDYQLLEYFGQCVQ